jgi:hypothetical protein
MPAITPQELPFLAGVVERTKTAIRDPFADSVKEIVAPVDDGRDTVPSQWSKT